MAQNLREFLGEFQRGIEVCALAEGADSLLGVRDAFLRFFRDDLGRPVPVAVVPRETGEGRRPLALSDETALARARASAAELEHRVPGVYHFYIAVEGCIHFLDVDGSRRYFTRSWAAVRGVSGESFGSSGSVEIPPQLVNGLSPEEVAAAVPSTKRGMVASLTGGLETRRIAVAESTLHALATQFHGIWEGHPRDPRR
jgi:non-canonical (house-cleaning) NTP pyrophosphatase